MRPRNGLAASGTVAAVVPAGTTAAGSIYSAAGAPVWYWR